MTSKTHVLGGMALYTIVAGVDPVGIVIAGACSKVPDMDLLLGQKFHRKGTHSLGAFLLFGIGLYGFLPEYFVAGLIGYLSHLFLDMLTPTGVPLLYPYKKYFKIPIITTGSLGDNILGLLMGAFLFLQFI